MSVDIVMEDISVPSQSATQRALGTWEIMENIMFFIFETRLLRKPERNLQFGHHEETSKTRSWRTYVRHRHLRSYYSSYPREILFQKASSIRRISPVSHNVFSHSPRLRCLVFHHQNSLYRLGGKHSPNQLFTHIIPRGHNVPQEHYMLESWFATELIGVIVSELSNRKPVTRAMTYALTTQEYVNIQSFLRTTYI